MANATHLLPLSFGSDDVPPHALHSEAPSQLHLCGPTVFIPIEFSIWRCLSSSTLLSLWCTASYIHSCYIPIIKCTTDLFVLALKWYFALVELFLFFPVTYRYQLPKGSIVSTYILCFALSLPLLAHFPPPPPQYPNVQLYKCEKMLFSSCNVFSS